MDAADQIWNRAIDIYVDDLDIGGPGDRALAATLLADGMIHNGGVMHAAEGLEREQLDAAIAGYRRLGAPTVADALARARAEIDGGITDDLARAEALEFETNQIWADAVGDAGALEALVRADLERAPHDYAPL